MAVRVLFLADGFAGVPLSVAERVLVLADGFALRAIANFAMFHRAPDFALRRVALDFTFRVGQFLQKEEKQIYESPLLCGVFPSS